MGCDDLMEPTRYTFNSMVASCTNIPAACLYDILLNVAKHSGELVCNGVYHVENLSATGISVDMDYFTRDVEDWVDFIKSLMDSLDRFGFISYCFNDGINDGRPSFDYSIHTKIDIEEEEE